MSDKSVLLLSKYASGLEPHVKRRYIEKISPIGIDPVSIDGKHFEAECLPPVDITDVFSYLVLETSYYTKEQFKNHKSTEAYKQLVSGWITDIQGHIIAEKHVVRAKIRHSQRMHDPLVPVWVIASKDGTVLSGHCTGCMAGLAESFTHVASVLYYIEAWNRINEKLACTEMKCTWILPSFVKDVEYARARDIDFSSARKLKTVLDQKIDNLSASPCHPEPQQPERKAPIPTATDNEMAAFYADLSKCSTKPVCLSLIEPYSEVFVLKSRNVPKVMDLFDKKYLDYSYPNLLAACAKVKQDTRAQAKGTSFFKHRAGRIGGSKCGTASRTNPAQPSQSLIKSICYPSLFKFSTKATEHGVKHEDQVIAAYESFMKLHHKDFVVSKCGTFINKQNQCLHATPDFLVSCSCCEGDGCGEIECPYGIKDCDFDAYVDTASTYLAKVGNGMFRLRRDHVYYDQCQQEIFSAEKEYLDCVICAFDKDGRAHFVFERLTRDYEHWNKNLPKLTKFWQTCVLPEVLGRWYTRKCDLPDTSANVSDICYCRMDTGQPTVKCTNSACPIQTFHLCCLSITSPIPRTWYCPHCRKLSEFQKTKKSTKGAVTVLNSAMQLDSICLCKSKAQQGDNLLECHNVDCNHGRFFHLKCLNYKRMPNNSKSTWQCPNCRKVKPKQFQPDCSPPSVDTSTLPCTIHFKHPASSTQSQGMGQDSNHISASSPLPNQTPNPVSAPDPNHSPTPSAPPNQVHDVQAAAPTAPSPLDDPMSTSPPSISKVDVIKEVYSESEREAIFRNLSDSDFSVILSPSGWLDCVIIQQAQVLLKEINPLLEGFQRTTLGPVRNFNIISSEFVQILHTGIGYVSAP